MSPQGLSQRTLRWFEKFPQSVPFLQWNTWNTMKHPDYKRVSFLRRLKLLVLPGIIYTLLLVPALSLHFHVSHAFVGDNDIGVRKIKKSAGKCDSLPWEGVAGGGLRQAFTHDYQWYPSSINPTLSRLRRVSRRGPCAGLHRYFSGVKSPYTKQAAQVPFRRPCGDERLLTKRFVILNIFVVVTNKTIRLVICRRFMEAQTGDSLLAIAPAKAQML